MVVDSSLNPQSVSLEFVRQYYTILNQSPYYLHRFYCSDSYFFHGGVEPYTRNMAPSIGRYEIQRRVQELNFRDCHVKILQVDSQNTLGNGIVIHVIGELSNFGQPMRRFTQTFVLAAQSPKKYYVYNDIFCYMDVKLHKDDVNGKENSEQLEVEENGEVEQASVIQQPRHQLYNFNTQIQGQTLNEVGLIEISTSIPVQQLPPEQIPIQDQQHIIDVMLNEDNVNEKAGSGQLDVEENREVEQVSVIQQPQHQLYNFYTQTQGLTLNEFGLNEMCTSIPVQQYPPEQILIQDQQHIDIMLNEDDVNEKVDSGQLDVEENGKNKQAPVIQPPQNQLYNYNTQTQGQTSNEVGLNEMPTMIPVQQLPHEQIPIEDQQQIPIMTAPVQNVAPTVLSPSSSVSRTQPVYNQNNKVSEEIPKNQSQEEPTIHHIDTKESQESIKDIQISEAISPGDRPKPLYAQLFKSGERSIDTHVEATQSVSVLSQNSSWPSLPTSTFPVRNNNYSNKSFANANNQHEQKYNVNKNMKNNNYNSSGDLDRKSNMNERPDQITFNKRDNGYKKDSSNDPRINRGNLSRFYNGMSLSDEQQLFIGKIPLKVQEIDLKNFFQTFGDVLRVRILRGGIKIGNPLANYNYGFVTFKNVETAHCVLKSRPIMFPDENGIKLNIEKSINKTTSVMVNSDGDEICCGGMDTGNNCADFNRN